MKNSMMVVALIALLATPAVAETAPGVSPQMQQALRARMQDRMRETDANGDGAISHEEFMNQAETRFKTADINGDGTITSDEFRQLQQKIMQQALSQRNAAATAGGR